MVKGGASICSYKLSFIETAMLSQQVLSVYFCYNDMEKQLQQRLQFASLQYLHLIHQEKACQSLLYWMILSCPCCFSKFLMLSERKILFFPVFLCEIIASLKSLVLSDYFIEFSSFIYICPGCSLFHQRASNLKLQVVELCEIVQLGFLVFWFQVRPEDIEISIGGIVRF